MRARMPELLLILLGCCCLVFQAGSSCAQERRALLIAISAYPNASDRLGGPNQDLVLMESLLRNWYGFKKITVLKNEQATRSAIVAELQKLSRSNPKDIIVIYYTGHGASYRGGLEAIFPVDGDRRNLKSVLTKSELSRLLGQIPSSRLTLVLDCCYSDLFTKSPKRPRLKCVEMDLPPEDAAASWTEKAPVVHRPGHTVVTAGNRVPDTTFHFARTSKTSEAVDVSALTAALYRCLIERPKRSASAVVRESGAHIKSLKIDQVPGVVGSDLQQDVFGGPSAGVGPRTLPVIDITSKQVVAGGGGLCGVRPGGNLEMLDSRGKSLGCVQVTGSTWKSTTVARLRASKPARIRFGSDSIAARIWASIHYITGR